jgi:alkanesulfonate monooxygenase SsuD/methylene tetrahydromethanopterin reductase-like flavin-dependent oxidoreductase (luciferase family)
MVSIFAVCGETEEEAEKLASSLDLSLLLIEKGEARGGIPSVETALNYPYDAFDRFRIKENRKRVVVGDPAHVKEKILRLSEAYQADEVMLVSIMHDFEAKLKSYRLIAEAFDMI